MSQPETCRVTTGQFVDQKIWCAKEVPCPHCGTPNTVLIDARLADEQTVKITYCDPEVGGCDKRFVVDGVFRPTFVCTTHKIEGLE